MFTIAFAFAIAFVVSLIAVPWVRRRAFHWGATDDSARARKVHRGVIPRLGGLAIAGGFFAAVVAMLAVETSVAQLFGDDVKRLVALFGGGIAMLALGVYDDLVGANAKQKFIVQVGAAILLCVLGFDIEHIALPWRDARDALHVGMWGVPLTVLWVVGITNAVNLIDGLDGLAAGVSLFALVALGVVAMVMGNVVGGFLVAALAGGVAGFLVHNFPPATIFMGDTGSLFIGFMLAATGLMTSMKSSATAALLIPILALVLPLIDTTLATVRRLVRGRSPFTPDMEHIHHRLLSFGLTHRRAVLELWAFCAVACVAAICMVLTHGTAPVVILVGFLAIAVLLGRLLGYFRVSYWLRHFRDGRTERRSFRGRKLALADVLSELRRTSDPVSAFDLLSAVHVLHAYDSMSLEVYPTPEPGDTPPAECLEWRREDGEAPSPDDSLEVVFELVPNRLGAVRVIYRYGDGRRQLEVDDELLMKMLHEELARGLARWRVDDDVRRESIEAETTVH